jgi:DNA polymerase-3 subunit beta
MAIAYAGGEVQIAFNPQFLLDPLRALSHDEVFFEFKDELSPGLFKTLDSVLCVIMPLRLN